MHGFDACRVGRYPSPVSPGKLAAYHHSLRMFRKAAKHFEPKLEIVELPFEGKTLVGYLQLPPGVAKPPVVLHWGGVDGWKEDRLRIVKEILHFGMASLTIDMPGSGENPVLYSDPAAERTYFAWMDYVLTRPEIDGSRLALWGGSFGAYWAARLAYVAKDRIRGAVFQGGSVHWLPEGMADPGLHHRRRDLSVRCAQPARGARPRDGNQDDGGIPRDRAALLAQGYGPDRPAVGADPRRQRQARRSGAGRRHLSADGARQPEGGACLCRRPSHGPHARASRPTTSRPRS